MNPEKSSTADELRFTQMERTYAEMETHSRAETVLSEKLSASICVYLRFLSAGVHLESGS